MAHENIKIALNSLSDFGINLVMDDFGAGYSSLNYLRHYPFKSIKIDRNFIHDLTNPKAETLVEAAIAIAHTLKLKATAEGIENEAQHKILQELKCDYGQGFYYSPPISDEKLFQITTSNSLKTEILNSFN